MKIKQLRNQFHSSLNDLYESTEIDVFFYTLMESFFKQSKIEVYLNENEVLEKERSDRMIKALSYLEASVPLQYITMETEFYSSKFELNKSVLIPRPETEELVDWILNDCQNSKNADLKLLDIGTGSGCIAITLAKFIENSNVFAIDISEAALDKAKINANKNKVSIVFKQSDVLSQKLPNDFPEFDVIVSNPPYVRDIEKKEIKDNVLKNEPHLALFVPDQNPLVFYEAILEASENKLKSGGKVFFEINQYLGAEMLCLFSKYDYNSIELRKDNFGNNRMLRAIKN